MFKIFDKVPRHQRIKTKFSLFSRVLIRQPTLPLFSVPWFYQWYSNVSRTGYKDLTLVVRKVLAYSNLLLQEKYNIMDDSRARIELRDEFKIEGSVFDLKG